MAARLIDLKKEQKRIIDLFRSRCAKLAVSRSQFYRHFLIDQDHIIFRGAQQNSSLRSAIEPMHIAALIIQGRIHYETSRNEHPIEVAIDGAFANFRYVEFQKIQGIAEVLVSRLQVRVVLRDGRVKIAVVTVYPMQGRVDEMIPEVNYEIW